MLCGWRRWPRDWRARVGVNGIKKGQGLLCVIEHHFGISVCHEISLRLTGHSQPGFGISRAVRARVQYLSNRNRQRR